MRLRKSFALFLALAFLPVGAGQHKKPRGKTAIEILRITSLRQEGRIVFEGELKVNKEKPIKGLVMHFSYFETGGDLLTIQKIPVENNTLAPGDEKQFQVQGRDVPRAVKFRVSVTDLEGRELSLANNGPYPLD